jgi:hypothetical protein
LSGQIRCPHRDAEESKNAFHCCRAKSKTLARCLASRLRALRRNRSESTQIRAIAVTTVERLVHSPPHTVGFPSKYCGLQCGTAIERTLMNIP